MPTAYYMKYEMPTEGEIKAKEGEPWKLRKVGVVGCGLMGSGIAHACAQSGYQVAASEISDELLNKGLAWINSFLNAIHMLEAGIATRLISTSALDIIQPRGV